MPSPNKKTRGVLWWNNSRHSYGGRFSALSSTNFPSTNTTDCNNNTTTNTKHSTGFTSMGNGTIPRRGSPPTVLTHNPSNALTTMSLQLGTLGNVARSIESTSPLTIQQRHTKLDRTMSEPLERICSQLTGRSNSLTNGTMCSTDGGSSASSRYKTELCRPYEENGICKYGDKCQFAHGMHEMRNLVRHPKYKTELCRTFHTSGFCPYGPRCHFIHNDEENGKIRSKSYSLDLSGDVTPDDLSSPRQKMSFFNDDVFANSFQPSSSPPCNVSTLSESFTFAHHDYQQKNKIQQLNSLNNRTQSLPYNAAISALLAQQRVGNLLNSDDDVFHSAGLDSPVSDDAMDDLSRRVEFLNLAIRLQQGNGHFPLFNRYHSNRD